MSNSYYTMERTSYILTSWWRYRLCTRQPRWIGF